MRRGSWPVLIALAAAFLAAFWLQRQRSTFLAIEADRAAAVALAAEHGISTAEAMALRELVGIEASSWRAAVATYAHERAQLGAPLAAVVVAGDATAARRAVQEANDATEAWQHFRGRPEALPGLRFLAMRERFAARAAARD